MLLFPPASRLEAGGIFSSDGVPLNQLCWQKHIIALTLKRKTTWMKPRHSLRNFRGHYSNDSATKLLNECSVSFMLSSFSKWGKLCFCQHNRTPSDEKIPAASSLLAGGKVAHFENDTASVKEPLNQNALSILDELGAKLLGNEYSIQYSKNQWHSIKNVVEITDQSRCILFGPPCIYIVNQYLYARKKEYNCLLDYVLWCNKFLWFLYECTDK